MFQQIVKTLKAIKGQYYNISAKRFGKHGKNNILELPMQINRPQNIFLGNDIAIRGNFLFISHTGKLIIKDHCQLAQHVTIITGNHTTHPPLHIWQDQANCMEELDKEEDIVIEADCWIGANVTILAGVTIGRGSIIGAGSVVTKSIPPYTIASGVPCKAKRLKYTEDEIIEREKLLYEPKDRFSPECINHLIYTFKHENSTLHSEDY